MKRKKILRLSEHDKKCITLVKEFLLENLASNHSLKELSSKAGVNRYKLTYGFRQLYGMSIHRFLIKQRMDNARKLLIETDKPIKEIAVMNSYRNYQNFITAFKKHSGYTPYQFRRNMDKD